MTLHQARLHPGLGWLGRAGRLIGQEAGEALALKFWRTRTLQGALWGQGSLGLSHPLHQGVDGAVALPRIVMEVQLLQLWGATEMNPGPDPY